MLYTTRRGKQKKVARKQRNLTAKAAWTWQGTVPADQRDFCRQFHAACPIRTKITLAPVEARSSPVRSTAWRPLAPSVHDRKMYKYPGKMVRGGGHTVRTSAPPPMKNTSSRLIDTVHRRPAPAPPRPTLLGRPPRSPGRAPAHRDAVFTVVPPSRSGRRGPPGPAPAAARPAAAPAWAGRARWRGAASARSGRRAPGAARTRRPGWRPG